MVFVKWILLTILLIYVARLWRIVKNRNKPKVTTKQGQTEMAKSPAPPSCLTSTANNGGTVKEYEVVPEQQNPAAVARNNYTAIEMIETKAYLDSNDNLSIRIQVTQKDTEIMLWSERIKTLMLSYPPCSTYMKASETTELLDCSRKVQQMKDLRMWDFVLSYQTELVLKLMAAARNIEARARGDS